MRPYLKLVTPPAALPLDLAEMKAHLRVDTSDDDEIITTYLTAATALLDGADGELGHAIMTQTWEQRQARPDTWGRVCPALGPVSALVSVYYISTGGIETEATLSDFQLISMGDKSYFEPVPGKSWPSTLDRPDALRIRYDAGHGDAEGLEPLPVTIAQAIKLIAAHWYEEREAAVPVVLTEIPLGVTRLINLTRRGWAA